MGRGRSADGRRTDGRRSWLRRGVTAGALVLGTGVLVACGPPAPEPPPGPQLVANPSEVVFTRSGSGSPGQVAAILFIENVGTVDTPISVRGDGGSRPFVSSSCSGVLAAGDRCQVTVQVSGAGPVSGTIFVSTLEGVVLQIPISGEI